MNDETTIIQPVSVTRYVIIFTAIYIAIMMAVQILIHVFNIDPGSSANTGMLIGAGLGAMTKFVNDHERAPIKSERVKLVWLSYLSSLIASIIFGAVAVFTIGGTAAFYEIGELLPSLPVSIWVGIFLVITLLYYVILRIIFGWGARLYLKSVNKKKSK